MPETAKGFQDSAVQSAAAPPGSEEGEDGPAGAKASSPPAEGDEPDRMAIVELTTQLETQLEVMPTACEKPVSPYPDFPETNPFRREALVTPAPAPTPTPAVRPREFGDEGPAGSLAHRRGSPSDLKVTIPSAATG